MGKQSRLKHERRESGDDMEKKIGQSGLEKACLFVIRWGTYLALFAPLVISIKFFFPFVSPKTVFFRIIVEIIFVAYLFLVFSRRRYLPKINGLTIALALFLAVFILASLTGVNFGRSFWSTYERMTGILTMLHLFAFFIILSSVFKKKEDWEKILGVSVLVGVLLSLYILKGSEISTRGGGTIGNTSFMAAYLLFDIFFALILFLSNFLKKGGWPLFWQIFSGISLLIMLPILFTSTARGAIVAFLLGVALLSWGYLIFSGRKILKRTALAIVLILILVGVSLAIIQPRPVKEEVSSTVAEMGSRFVVWETARKGFLEKPILGWGPENFNNVYLKYFNPCMSLPKCGTEVWFDRVHNIIFDTLVTTGLVGLLSYLSIFGVAIYGLFRILLKTTERKNVFVPLGLIILLAVYFFQNLLVFDMINTYLVFFLSLAFIGFLTKKQTEITEEKEIQKKANPVFISGAIIVMILVLWTTNIRPMIANYYIIKTVGAQYVDEAALFFQKSLSSWMNKYETREQFAQKIYQSAYDRSMPQEQKEGFQQVLNLAETEMEKSIQENFLDFRPHLFLGELYISSYRLSGNQEKLERAEQVLEKAVQLSPANQQGYWQLAEVKLIKGQNDQVNSLLKKAVELEPRVGLAHWYLATGYRFTGDYELALIEAKKAKENGYYWPNRSEDVKSIIQIANALGVDPYSIIAENDIEMMNIMLKVLNDDPNDYVAWFYLATSYANLGQYEKAREAAQKVIEINPDLTSNVEKFLESLPR